MLTKKKDFPPLDYCSDFTGKAEVWILPLHQGKQRVLSIVIPKERIICPMEPAQSSQDHMH